MPRTYGYGSVYFRQRDRKWVAAAQIQGRGTRKRKVFTATTREAVQAKLDAYRTEVPAPPLMTQTRGELLAEMPERHTRGEWWALVRARKGLCEYCGHKTIAASWVGISGPPERVLVKDHRTPLSRGGTDAIENIAVCCRACNQSKGTLTAEEFMHWRATRAEG